MSWILDMSPPLRLSFCARLQSPFTRLSRVYRVGEIERRAARGKVHHVAFGREYEYAVGEDVGLERLLELRVLGLLAQLREPFRRGGAAVAALGGAGELLAAVLRFFPVAAEGRYEALYPVEARLPAAGSAPASLLVGHVRGDAVLGILVHLRGADLDLDDAAVAREHGRVQAAVAVGLGEGDIVLDLVWKGLPEIVHQPERAVAVLDALHDDADGGDVVDLGYVAPFALELLRQAPEPLYPVVDAVF